MTKKKGRDFSNGRGKYRHDCILAALKKSPMTAKELADCVYLVRDGVNVYLRFMKRDGEIHVCGYRHNPKGGRKCPVYAFGKGDDAEYVPARAPKRHLIVEQHKDRIVDLLSLRAMNVRQLAAGIGRTETWTRQLVQQLREEKRIYVSAHGAGFGPRPIYSAGNLPDAKRQLIDSTTSSRRRVACKPLWLAALVPQQVPSRLLSSHTGNLNDEPVRIVKAALGI